MSSAQIHFTTIQAGRHIFWLVCALLIAVMVVGYFAAHSMEQQGHWISGMNNQVVWGLPHVFAISLILGASGALNVASLSSVFGGKSFSLWSRFSAVLAVCLLVGGLIVLVLDLGRPERLIVAMTHYNFKSVFAWNIFLYSGFVVVVAVYLWTMFERSLHRYVKLSGTVAFIWRFILTSGTGAIFGFLVARQGFDSAMMIPVFIALSLVIGTSLFILTACSAVRISGSIMNSGTMQKLGRLLGWFAALQLLLVIGLHLTNLYATEHHGFERFILLEGGKYSLLFWIGQIVVGLLVPILLTIVDKFASWRYAIVVAAAAAIAGGMCQIYVTIIGGQVFPMSMFPGKSVTSAFYDGVIAHYTASGYEYLLGLGGIALSLLLLLLMSRVLPVLPDSTRNPTQAD